MTRGCAHDVDILITPSVKQALDPRFALRELPARLLKGISEPVTTFAVLGKEDLP